MTSHWAPPSSYKSRPVAVLGGGVLGRRIACCWVSAGYTVNIRDPSETQRNDALKFVQENVNDFAKATNKTPGKVDTYEDLETAVKDAWLVFEAVPENLQIKIDTFAELEKHAPKDCILASNSSSYKSSEMLEKVNDDTKTRILNVHYMMPPENRVVEMMTDGATHSDIFPFLVERHREAGLDPYVALKESTGFIFNRLWAAIKRESLMILSEGVTDPETLDELFKKMYSAPYGPCFMMDHVGLDTVASIEKHYVKERNLPSKHTVDYLEEEYLKQGKLGIKSDKGGLYPPSKEQQKASSETKKPKIIALDVGLGQPLADKSVEDVVMSGKILEISGDGKTVRELAGKLGLPDGVDVCDADGRFYWTDMGIPAQNNGRVLSCKPDGSDMKTVMPRGSIHTPKQLIVEQKTKKLYVSDREGLRVFRCDLDGSNVEVLIQTGNWHRDKETNDQTRWCVGMAVSTKLGKFFWTQKGPPKMGEGRIFSANIDMPANQSATDRQDIQCLLDDLPEPIDLEVDDETGTLYWTDRGDLPYGNTLNKMHLDGSGNPKGLNHGKVKHDIIAQNFHEAIGLKLDAKNKVMYVADFGGALYKCHLDSGKKEKIFDGEDTAFTGVALLWT